MNRIPAPPNGHVTSIDACRRAVKAVIEGAKKLAMALKEGIELGSLNPASDGLQPKRSIGCRRDIFDERRTADAATTRASPHCACVDEMLRQTHADALRGFARTRDDPERLAFSDGRWLHDYAS
jgi:hypothetical protein